jgi:hypothetical protein
MGRERKMVCRLGEDLSVVFCIRGTQ